MCHALIGQLMLLLGTPLGVCRVLFCFCRGWETVSFLLLQQWPLNCTLASLSRHLSLFFPAPFTPHCLHYLNTWNRLLSPILWWIWVSQLKRNEFKSGGCLYTPSPHALQRKDRRKCNFQHSGHQWDTAFLTFYRDCYFMKNTRVRNQIRRSCFFVPFKSDQCESYKLLDGINRQSLR